MIESTPYYFPTLLSVFLGADLCTKGRIRRQAVSATCGVNLAAIKDGVTANALDRCGPHTIAYKGFWMTGRVTVAFASS